MQVMTKKRQKCLHRKLSFVLMADDHTTFLSVRLNLLEIYSLIHIVISPILKSASPLNKQVLSRKLVLSRAKL